MCFLEKYTLYTFVVFLFECQNSCLPFRWKLLGLLFFDRVECTNGAIYARMKPQSQVYFARFSTIHSVHSHPSHHYPLFIELSGGDRSYSRTAGTCDVRERRILLPPQLALSGTICRRYHQCSCLLRTNYNVHV